MSQWRIDQKDTIGPISLINDSGDIFTATDEDKFTFIYQAEEMGGNASDYSEAELSELRSLIGELLNAHHARQQGKIMRSKL